MKVLAILIALQGAPALGAPINVYSSANDLVRQFELDRGELQKLIQSMKQEYRETQGHSVLYHWGDSHWYEFPHTPQTDHPAFLDFLRQGSESYGKSRGGGEFGDGLYLARNPITAGNFGDILFTVVVPKGTPYLQTAGIQFDGPCGSAKAKFYQQSGPHCKAYWMAALKALKIKMMAYDWTMGGNHTPFHCEFTYSAFVVTDPYLFRKENVMGMYPFLTKISPQHRELSQLFMAHKEFSEPHFRIPFLGNPKPLPIENGERVTFACDVAELNQKTKPPEPDLDYPHDPKDPTGCEALHVPVMDMGFVEEVRHALRD